MRNNAFLKETPASLFAGRSDEPGRRLGEMIIPASLNDLKRGDMAIIGFSEYQGIVNNGGRVHPGGQKDAKVIEQLRTAGGPLAIRQRLYSMTSGSFRARISPQLRIVDVGDVQLTDGSLATDLQRLSELVTAICQKGAIPIVLGGGHHTSIGSIGGVAAAVAPGELGLLVVDAHCDFRELTPKMIHSGQPFRYLLSKYPQIKPAAMLEIGLRPERNAAAHIDALRQLGVGLVERQMVSSAAIRQYLQHCQTEQGLFLSVDIDAFAVSGASAAYPGGLAIEFGRELMQQAARQGKILGLDICEVNPLLGEDSAELAAQLLWVFLAASG
jgi:formiminoglutamase